MSIIRNGFIAIVLTSSTPTLAANWLYVTTSTSDTDYYIDIDSVSAGGSTYDRHTNVWVKLDEKNNMKVSHRESKVLYQIKCQENTMRFSYWIDYDSNGSVMKSTTNPSYNEFDPVVPESVGNTILETVCSKH